MVSAYILAFACLALVAYLFDATVWSWLVPGIGGLIGLVLVNTSPLTRFLARRAASRRGGPQASGR
jgi:hypothetical protein